MNTIRCKVLRDLTRYTFTVNIPVSPWAVPTRGGQLFYIDDYNNCVFELMDGATIPLYRCEASPHWSPL